MDSFPSDIYTEPEPDPDTLSHLGPLRPLAGRWHGEGLDEHPVATGTEVSPYLEDYDLQPIDPQTNGPQLLYGLRYHTHIVEPGRTETFHDQVGYWLWEPETTVVTLMLAIPRAQVLLATGKASADASSFELSARAGAEDCGTCSGEFLLYAFRTIEYHIEVAVNPDGTWSYAQDTVMLVRGRSEPFHHTDRNTLRQVAPPTPNA